MCCSCYLKSRYKKNLEKNKRVLSIYYASCNYDRWLEGGGGFGGGEEVGAEFDRILGREDEFDAAASIGGERRADQPVLQLPGLGDASVRFFQGLSV